MLSLFCYESVPVRNEAEVTAMTRSQGSGREPGAGGCSRLLHMGCLGAQDALGGSSVKADAPPRAALRLDRCLPPKGVPGPRPGATRERHPGRPVRGDFCPEFPASGCCPKKAQVPLPHGLTSQYTGPGSQHQPGHQEWPGKPPS